MANKNSFLGKGWSFPPTFHKESYFGIEMVENQIDIQQSLEILLNTSKGERVMLPDYGCDLQTFLFESINDSKIHLLKEIIRSAIVTYEPRVELNDVIVDYSDYQDGIIRIKLDYIVESTNTRFNLVFPYYKVEGTNIPLYYKQVTHSKVSEGEQS